MEKVQNEKRGKKIVAEGLSSPEKCSVRSEENVKSRLEGKEGEVIRSRAKRLMYMGVMFFASWLITGAEFIFETYPFSIALVCAANTFYIPISLGFILGYIFSDMGSGYLFAYIAIFAVKLIMSYMPMPIADRELEAVDDGIDEGRKTDLLEDGGSFIEKRGLLDRILLAFKIQNYSIKAENNREKVIMSAAFAGIGGFVAGLFDLIVNSFSFYSLYGLMLLTLLCPILAHLLFGIARAGDEVSNIKLCAAILTLMVICVYSSGEIMVLGMMLKPMLSVCFTLAASHRKGPLSGCLTALLCGAVFSPLYLPLIFLCAIIYCFVKEFKMSAAIAAVCGAIVLYCYYFGKADGLVSMLTPMLLGVPLFLLSVRFLEFTHPIAQRDNAADNIYFQKAIIEKDKNCAVSSRIYAISDAFSSLSKTFYELSDSFHRPESLPLRDITDESFTCVCDGCRHREVCHGADYSELLDANSKITSALHSKGIVEKADIPDKFRARCIRIDRIVSTVNELCAKYTEQMIKGKNFGVRVKLSRRSLGFA